MPSIELIFFSDLRSSPVVHPTASVSQPWIAVVLLSIRRPLGPRLGVRRIKTDSNAEFKKMVEQLSQARLDGTAESEA